MRPRFDHGDCRNCPRLKNAPHPGGHFHDEQTLNVASRVLTMFYYSDKKNKRAMMALYRSTVFLLELRHLKDIIRTNDLTKFLEGCTVNVISRVENCYALNGHGFKPTEHF
ncbi:hypothetical protein DPMN_156691 [Dreissena polymorpha]|uniref:Uncharacterized protein n=1 Tax=Dreissena polymorpha TaxID=45954 RepID=A0A9D4FTL4_DREPO|nr:hypothetical protein DPMN_156691 [Dreissena polymorpha]